MFYWPIRNGASFIAVCAPTCQASFILPVFSCPLLHYALLGIGCSHPTTPRSNGIMGKKVWNFVNVGQDGHPKHANDRVTIRKAAMQNFRRQKRLEQVKAFNAECIAQAKVRTGLSTSVCSIPSPQGQRGSGVRGLQRPTEAVSHRLGGQASADDRLHAVSVHQHRSLETATLLGLPKELGYPSGDSHEGISGLAYLFNYCMYIVLDLPLAIAYRR